MILAPIRRVPLIFLGASILGCTVEPPDPPVSRSETSRVITDEDRRLARMLSIGTSSLQNASPEGRALLCEMSLNAIADQLKASGALSAQQRQAFDRARDIYRRRAIAGYGETGKLQEARQAAERDYPGRGEKARLAITCLRDLS